MPDALIQEIRDRFEYAKAAWQDIRTEGAKDMRFVAGDPWDQADKDQRKDRPTVAPEEMGQYFNQVVNNLRANPRGMRFTPRGNGASPEGARFYQNKARETEYRSHAKIAYIAAAENAIQRSYGFVRVNTRYASSRSANQEIWIEDLPDPDVVLPDPDAKRPDSSDMQFCFVLNWTEQAELKRRRSDLTVTNFDALAVDVPAWIQGTKILQAEYWTITTRPRKLVLVQPPVPQLPQAMRTIAPPEQRPPAPVEVFDDEVVAQFGRGAQILKDLRTVDYPAVKQYLTNGLEIFGGKATDWPGKYIPIVSCYGKILYVPEGGQVKRKILSMTRFGRDPWKSFCYACSQQLEVLGLVPKASLLVARGQMTPDELKNVAKAMHEPVAALTYGATIPDLPNVAIPPPIPLEYPVGQHLQSLELVKEGFRRSIQAAMGSNFLPTQAQRRNEKSGVALDKIDQAASTGTFHFVDHYDDMIRQVAVIFEDLCDKIYDYRGETGVLEADGQAQTIRINTGEKDAVNTKGDYGCTVSTGPSSDSEQTAAAEFTDTLVSNLQMIAGVAGPKVAAAVLARAIRMRNLGPQGDQLADMIEPAEFKTKDGQPPSPELMGAKAQIEHLTQLLQQAAQEKHAKVVETQGKFSIAKMQEDAETARDAADREAKLASRRSSRRATASR
jgi:hypothetical protein